MGLSTHPDSPAANGSVRPSGPAPASLEAKVQSLTTENAQLREQVKRLMAAENRLYTLQDHLSSQQRVYVRLTELARSLNALMDVDKILEAAVKFVVYDFSYERCVAFVRDPNQPTPLFRARAHDGYYEPEARQKIAEATLTGQEPALAGIHGDPGFICHCADVHDADTKALGDVFLLDEYYVFALPRKEGGLLGFLVAGNTREQSRYQTGVSAEGEMLVAFSNLANHTATVLNQVRSFRALERERELLDQMVADRTRELSEALDTAQEAVRIKAQFLANVSHELRTPLNTIVNVPRALAADYTRVDVLRCRACAAQFQSDGGEDRPVCPDCGGALENHQTLVCAADAEEHLRFLKLLEQQATHLLGLVEDVLSFSRIDAGRMELHPTEIDVADLLNDVESTILAANRGGERRMLYAKADSSMRLVADRLRVKQVLLNLIGNAIKFTNSDGTIRVNVEQESESRGIVFTIQDDGIGIPPDQIDVIFESFRQVDGSHTRSHGGAGLGLAISRQLVEMHGGKISVESRPNEGSSFRVWLPQDQSIGARAGFGSAPDTAPSSAPALGFGRVLVIDDEAAQLSVARKLLESEGYEVQLISDPRDALDAIRRAGPRFVVLDLMMPEVNGLTVLAQIRRDEACRGVPVIVSTAFHYNRARVDDLGGIWMPKPWNMRSLSARNIEALLANAIGPGTSVGSNTTPLVRKAKLSDSISRVLYVEDEDANWDVTELSLRGKYDLKRARNSKEAFDLLRAHSFDLVLMDIQLAGSGLNGIQICRVLTGKYPGAVPEEAKGLQVPVHYPIVFVTAYSSLYTREELLASGAQDMVTKPVDFTHLLMVVSRLMVKGALSGVHDA